MTDKPAASPHRVGGTNLAFAAAHGVAERTGLSFEDAYLLARIVLHEGGGPVSCRGRGPMIKKPAEKAMMDPGLIDHRDPGRVDLVTACLPTTSANTPD